MTPPPFRDILDTPCTAIAGLSSTVKLSQQSQASICARLHGTSLLCDPPHVNPDFGFLALDTLVQYGTTTPRGCGVLNPGTIYHADQEVLHSSWA